MNFESRMSNEEQERRLEGTLKAPLQKFLDIKVTGREPGYSTVEMTSSENAMNTSEKTMASIGRVHGGVIYAMLDVTAYIALLPLMEDNQNAVTHNISVNVMKPVPFGKKVIFKGIIRKVGSRIAFCDSEAYCDGELIATGRITKTIISYER